MSSTEIKNIESVHLFNKVVLILEEARTNVVRSVNSKMVLANWLIGREIVLEIQNGETRAEYGKKVIEGLSIQLQGKYGKGFSIASLKLFRQFYTAYLDEDIKSYPAGSEFKSPFSPHLTWSHYRALMRVENEKAREFYENETIEGAWDKRTLERQIHSSYFERMLKSQNQEKMIDAGRQELSTKLNPIDTLKNPYVLEFLDLPDSPILHESDIENGIIEKLQSFLLELGKGFAFVGRQKKMSYESRDFFIDLVF